MQRKVLGGTIELIRKYFSVETPCSVSHRIQLDL